MEIYKNSPAGNPHSIMGLVRKLLFEVGRKDEWAGFRERMTSGDYDNLCAVAAEATFGSITVVDSEEDDG